jgi:hypothetical protein
MSKKGSHLSQATKNKIKAKLKGRKAKPSAIAALRRRRGRKLSIQTRAKISAGIKKFHQTGQHAKRNKKLTMVQLAKLRAYQLKRRLKLHHPAKHGSPLHRKRISMGLLIRHRLYKRKKPYSRYV